MHPSAWPSAVPTRAQATLSTRGWFDFRPTGAAQAAVHFETPFRKLDDSRAGPGRLTPLRPVGSLPCADRTAGRRGWGWSTKGTGRPPRAAEPRVDTSSGSPSSCRVTWPGRPVTLRVREELAIGVERRSQCAGSPARGERRPPLAQRARRGSEEGGREEAADGIPAGLASVHYVAVGLGSLHPPLL